MPKLKIYKHMENVFKTKESNLGCKKTIKIGNKLDKKALNLAKAF